MTPQEKIQVNALRSQGKGPKEISLITNISINTIKSYLKNHKEISTKPLCLCCGKELDLTKGKKTKKFCSDACRMKYWNTHLNLVKRYAYYTIRCKECGKEFIVYGNKNRKYCSRECYFKHKKGL